MIDLLDKNIGIIIYSVGILAVLLTAISSYLEKNDIENRWKKVIIRCTFFAAVLGSLTLLSQWRKDFLSDQKQQEVLLENKQSNIILSSKADTINTFQHYLQDSVARVIKQQSTSLQKLDASISKQNDLIEAQRETIKQFIGEGFPIVFFNGRDKIFFDATVRNKNIGYPLHDVQISVIDFSKLKPLDFREDRGMCYFSNDSLKKYSKDFREISIAPMSSSDIPYTFAKNTLPKYLLFKSVARNGPTFQYSIISESKGYIYHTFRIYKAERKKFTLLYEEAPLKFDEKIWNEKFVYKKQFRAEYH